VGVAAGESAPARLVEKVLACLSGLGSTEVTTHPATNDNDASALPEEVGTA
jgi:hypothetical protein